MGQTTVERRPAIGITYSGGREIGYGGEALWLWY